MRLIDADKAKKSIEQAFLQHRLGTFTIGDVCDCIDNQPTIDAEPVVHGHWVKRYKSKYYHCSVCGGLVEDEWHNCPHCRAKMDEEQKCET